jgi:hypothetical protein
MGAASNFTPNRGPGPNSPSPCRWPYWINKIKT